MMQRNITLLKKAWTGIQSITAKITGTNTDAVYVETSDANATAADMRNGKSGYVNGSKVSGNMPDATLDEFTVSISKDTSTHVATCTPYIITENGGYLDADEYTGTASTVSASELVSGSETKTENGTYDVTNLAQLVVNVSGGGGLTKLATKDLGTISTSATQATDTGQTISVTGFDGYDMLVCIAHTSPHTNGRHVATVRLVNLAATSNVATKTGTGIATSTQHYKLSSSGTLSCRVGTTPYGVYVYSATLSTSGTRTITFTIYERYNSTSTGTLNGHYIMDVYGVKLRDML